MLTIERFTKDDKRYYRGLGHVGESVTTLIGAFEDKSWMDRWYLSLGKKHFAQLNQSVDDHDTLIAVGKKYAQEISSEASSHGTNQHEVAEFVLRSKDTLQDNLEGVDLPPMLKQFLFNNIDPDRHEKYPDGIGCEVPVMFEKGGNAVGGTTDLICHFSTQNLYDHETKEKLKDNVLLCVGDYKFPKKPKYNRDNIKYFIQLATYRAGIKYTYDVDIDNALLIVSPRSTKNLYLWLFEKDVLDYYYEIFLEMLFLYNNDMTCYFDWEEFVNNSIEKNMIGRRLVYKHEQ